MTMQPIDVWDDATFDRELMEQLTNAADMIAAYFDTENKIFLDHDLGRNRSLMRPNNPHTGAYCEYQEHIGQLMGRRTIRAYHYARMTDEEVVALRRHGIHLSTPDSLKLRCTSCAELVAVVPGRATPASRRTAAPACP